jgi:hypothetical protein
MDPHCNDPPNAVEFINNYSVISVRYRSCLIVAGSPHKIARTIACNFIFRIIRAKRYKLFISLIVAAFHWLYLIFHAVFLLSFLLYQPYFAFSKRPLVIFLYHWWIL